MMATWVSPLAPAAGNSGRGCPLELASTQVACCYRGVMGGLLDLGFPCVQTPPSPAGCSQLPTGSLGVGEGRAGLDRGG